MSKRKPGDGAARAAPAPTSQLEDRSVIDLIVDIRERRADPRMLTSEDRRACVAHLGAEGLSVAETAQFLKCSDRTIFRDRQALQEAAALTHDPGLAGRVAGHVMSEAAVCTDRLLRLARDRSVEPQTRLEAYRACFPIMAEKVKLLQSLGFLPSSVRQINARLTHAVEEIPTAESLAAEFARLRGIAEQEGGASIVEVDAVEALAARAELAVQLEAKVREQQRTQES